MSTLPADSTYNYRYNTYKIKLPGKYKKADKIWKDFLYGSKTAPAHATQIGNYGGVTRMARCRIPNDEALFQWLDKRFRNFKRGSWFTTRSKTSSKEDGGHTSAIICDDWRVASVCDGNGENCVIKVIDCIRYHYEYGPALPEVSDDGNGSSQGGPTEDGCTPCTQDPTGPQTPCSSQPGSPTGCSPGGGAPPPPPTDPCDYANAPAYCSEPDLCDTNGEYPPIDDAEIQHKMNRYWEESHGPDSNPLPDDARNEKMGFIIKNGDTYSVQNIEPYNNDVSSCHIHLNTSIPSNAVGFLHTHPYKDGEKIKDPRCLAHRGYDLQAHNGNYPTYNADQVSTGDRKLSQQGGLPIFIIDEDNIHPLKPSNSYQYKPNINRCGY